MPLGYHWMCDIYCIRKIYKGTMLVHFFFLSLAHFVRIYLRHLLVHG
jgi:hypothetical protein